MTKSTYSNNASRSLSLSISWLFFPLCWLHSPVASPSLVAKRPETLGLRFTSLKTQEEKENFCFSVIPAKVPELLLIGQVCTHHCTNHQDSNCARPAQELGTWDQFCLNHKNLSRRVGREVGSKRKSGALSKKGKWVLGRLDWQMSPSPSVWNEDKEGHIWWVVRKKAIKPFATMDAMQVLNDNRWDPARSCRKGAREKRSGDQTAIHLAAWGFPQVCFTTWEAQTDSGTFQVAKLALMLSRYIWSCFMTHS